MIDILLFMTKSLLTINPLMNVGKLYVCTGVQLFLFTFRRIGYSTCRSAFCSLSPAVYQNQSPQTRLLILFSQDQVYFQSLSSLFPSFQQRSQRHKIQQTECNNVSGKVGFALLQCVFNPHHTTKKSQCLLIYCLLVQSGLRSQLAYTTKIWFLTEWQLLSF